MSGNRFNAAIIQPDDCMSHNWTACLLTTKALLLYRYLVVWDALPSQPNAPSRILATLALGTCRCERTILCVRVLQSRSSCGIEHAMKQNAISISQDTIYTTTRQTNSSTCPLASIPLHPAPSLLSPERCFTSHQGIIPIPISSHPKQDNNVRS